MSETNRMDRVRDNLRVAVSDSRTLTTLETGWRSSWLHQTAGTFRQAWDTAQIRTGGRHAIAILAAAVKTAGVSRILRSLGRWGRSSFLYRWLTKEPEPDVIVIDLRDTYTVAPFIALLDRVIHGFERSYPGSRLSVISDRIGSQIRATPLKVGSVVLATIALVLGVTGLVRSSLDTVTLVSILLLLGVSAAGVRMDMTWKELVATKPVRVLIAVFEPPEPPDSEVPKTEKEGPTGTETGTDPEN